MIFYGEYHASAQLHKNRLPLSFLNQSYKESNKAFIELA